MEKLLKCCYYDTEVDSKKKTYQNPSVLWAEGFFASENEIYLCGFYVFYAKSCVWTGKTEAFMVV